MDDRQVLRPLSTGLEPGHVGSRVIAHHGKHTFDRLQHAEDAAERKCRRDETYHLSIGIVVEAPDNLDGISR